MSKHWNGTGKASTATGRWRLLSSAALLICLIITGCKNREERAPTDKVPIMENNNDRYSAGKDTAEYRTVVFPYDNKMKVRNAEDEYNDRFDDYQDDPEDELRFDPEIFDFQDD